MTTETQPDNLFEIPALAPVNVERRVICDYDDRIFEHDFATLCRMLEGFSYDDAVTQAMVDVKENHETF